MKKKEKKILLGLLIACIISVLLMAAALVWYFVKLDRAKFIPPEFDPAVVRQEPPASIDGWREVTHSEYTFGICGKLNRAEGKSATIWLYNDAENEGVWLKLRVKDASGNVLGETGLVKPGESLEKVQLSRAVKEGEKLTYYVMAYDKDYHSLTPFPFEPKIS